MTYLKRVGATLKQGYKIPFQGTEEDLAEFKRELDLNRAMGVMAKAGIHEVLHSVLTLTKPGGGKRWVVTCVTANDITVVVRTDSVDNVAEMQKRMRGAKYFWVADLRHGFWQLLLDERCHHLFCFDTPFGPMKHLRAPMGGATTAPYFDLCMREMLTAGELYQQGRGRDGA